MFQRSSLIILCSLVALVYGRSLPSFIKPCKRNDPQLEKCLIELIEGIRSNLAKGIPEMRIPPLDPLHVPQVTLDQGSGSVNFQAKFKNIIASGAKNFNLTGVRLDFNVPSLSIDVGFPALRLDSDYNITGKVLVVPIKGNGKCQGNFTNVFASVKLLGKYDKRDGKTFLSVKERKINLKIGNLQIHFSNLFNGNKQLSESTNVFINENWRDILQEINPLVEDTIGEVMMQIIKGLLDLYSLEDLIPY
uniref:Protein takeout-like protein n=1 Tax=Maconellicoccus hirsutus TaxID=177089 RepID=A0AAU6SH69_MACHI